MPEAILSGYHRHPNGEGLVADTAEVDAETFVGPDASVNDFARVTKSHLSGISSVEGFATVDRSTLQDRSVVKGAATVRQDSELTKNSTVCGNASVQSGKLVSGWVGDHATVRLATLTDTRVQDSACLRGESGWPTNLRDCVVGGTACIHTGRYRDMVVMGGTWTFQPPVLEAGNLTFRVYRPGFVYCAAFPRQLPVSYLKARFDLLVREFSFSSEETEGLRKFLGLFS